MLREFILKETKEKFKILEHYRTRIISNFWGTINLFANRLWHSKNLKIDHCNHNIAINCNKLITQRIILSKKIALRLLLNILLHKVECFKKKWVAFNIDTWDYPCKIWLILRNSPYSALNLFQAAKILRKQVKKKW